MSGTPNPFESLKDAIAFSSADWGQTQDMAWVYGIVLGWDADPGEDEDGAMNELAGRFGWDVDTVTRLRRLHREYQREARAYKAVVCGE